MTVEEAWKHYQVTPLDKTKNPEYVKKIEDFNIFKQQWIEAYKFIEDNKEKTTRDSWDAYKVNILKFNFLAISLVIYIYISA